MSTKSPPLDVVTVMHSVAADNMILVYSLKASERSGEQISSIIEGVGPDAAAQVEFLYSDSPTVLDDVALLNRELPNVHAVAKDPVHVAIKVEKAFGKRRTVSHSGCAAASGNSVYLMRMASLISEEALDMPLRQANRRVSKIDTREYTLNMYDNMNGFVRDVRCSHACSQSVHEPQAERVHIRHRIVAIRDEPSRA